MFGRGGKILLVTAPRYEAIGPMTAASSVGRPWSDDIGGIQSGILAGANPD